MGCAAAVPAIGWDAPVIQGCSSSGIALVLQHSYTRVFCTTGKQGSL